MRLANGIIAGISKMHWLKFVSSNALGAALWVGLWTTVGYTAGNHIDVLYHRLVHYEICIGVAIVVFIVAYIGRRLWTHHHRGPGFR